jgi:hypothetical protein
MERIGNNVVPLIGDEEFQEALGKAVASAVGRTSDIDVSSSHQQDVQNSLQNEIRMAKQARDSAVNALGSARDQELEHLAARIEQSRHLLSESVAFVSREQTALQGLEADARDVKKSAQESIDRHNKKFNELLDVLNSALNRLTR